MILGFETEQTEFKKTTGELKEGIISIASMLNKHKSGTLYFGVNNNGSIVGQQIGNDTLREISQAIANFIKPQIIPSISLELIDDKNVVKVYAEGNDRPYSAYGKYYMRSADEDREISPAVLRTLMMNNSDSMVNMESVNQELSFSQLKMMYANAGLTLHDDTFKHNLNLLMQNGKYNLMAYILADNNSFSIKIAKFKGKDKTELITRNEYGYKCLLLAVKQVLDYAEAINETSVIMTGGQRKETKLFDMDCFREAWLNACLHNSWVKKTPPAVYFFEDRIEIISIGGLPDDYSLDDFYAGRSRPVNLELQQIMVQLDFIEQTGHGVPLIVSRYGKNVFDITENFITVTLPLNVSREENMIKDISDNDLNNTQALILEMISADNSVTIKEMADMSGLSVTAVNNAIKSLKDQGVLSRTGTRKKGQWCVLK
ncbi:MAG: winged helix-turn-helix transcriptional regulator [Ruminococcaceae bacterium]|nr:winged helix-turn-helix transcriptional regulator [Oscillospiraceae bacterium]